MPCLDVLAAMPVLLTDGMPLALGDDRESGTLSSRSCSLRSLSLRPVCAVTSDERKRIQL